MHTEPHRFTTRDGVALAYHRWPAADPAAPRRTLVLLHRGHEHGRRFDDVVGALGLADTDVYAWDARGHGASPGERGHAPSFATLAADLDDFMRHLAAAHGIDAHSTCVLAHSVGAVVAAAWVHDYAPPIRGLILAAPAFRVKLYVPLAIPTLRVAQRLRGARPLFAKSYVSPRMLTHDRAQAQRLADDPLTARAISVPVLLGLRDTADRLVADAAAIHTPTLLLAAGSDRVVKVTPQRRFFERLSSPMKRMRVFDRLFHGLLHEGEGDAGRGPVLDEVRRFLGDVHDQPPAAPPHRLADRYGPTADEYNALRRPLPLHRPRRWGYAAQRLGLRTLGRLSEGVRVGRDTGFDSGRSLDYVYEDRACGRLGVGRLIDRAYLNAVGWRGIRTRREHLRTLLLDAIDRAALDDSRDGSVQLLELATGCGRYVLDALAETPHAVTATLRDLNEPALAVGRERAAAMGLTEPAVTFEPGDAFDAGALTAAGPVDVAVVSGLYELFPDNAPIRTSLAGVAGAVRPGGWLLYTGQPWHPQVEMIARTLSNREGEPWVMRRRTQAELDALVAEAGFAKQAMRIDDDGIFTVSLAQRVAPARPATGASDA